MMTFREMVKQELESVRRKVQPFNSFHEALGILWEEFSEFRDEVFKKERKRDKDNMLRELVQIAGICERISEDLLHKEIFSANGGPVS